MACVLCTVGMGLHWAFSTCLFVSLVSRDTLWPHGVGPGEEKAWPGSKERGCYSQVRTHIPALSPLEVGHCVIHSFSGPQLPVYKTKLMRVMLRRGV